MNVWLTESFPTHWKEQMSLRFKKKGTIMKRKTIAQWVYSQTFSKVFEKLLFEQINDHMQSKFSEHLTGFRKKSQHSNRKFVKRFVNDLSKAFETLDHSLFLAKLSVYSFDNRPYRITLSKIIAMHFGIVLVIKKMDSH